MEKGIEIYRVAKGEVVFNVDAAGETLWATQAQIAQLFDVTIPNINMHLKRIYNEGELNENRTIKKNLIVQKEGNRDVERNTIHYNLQMIIAVGFKIDNERAVRFRIWANQIVKTFTIKGWVMDEERFKNGGTLTPIA
jgi:hypothetical protein